MTGTEHAGRSTDRPTRRRVLRASAAGSVLLAGCLGTEGNGDGDEDAADGDTADGGEPSDDGEPPEDDDGADEDDDRPVTGETVPELEAVDEATLAYMDDLDLGAGAVAIARDGDLVFERGYGWGDPDRTEPAEPDAFYRIGSISKLFTGEAVLRLIDEGELALDDAVYPLLEVEPPGGDLADERVRDVTVEHLLNHAGGWDRFEHANPLYNPQVVMEALELEEPPDAADVIRYMLDQPLQFAPGSDTVYSNFGYVLLARVVENVTGEPYQEHLERVLFEPAGVEGIELGHTPPSERPDDEIWYDDAEQCPSVFGADGETSCADGGFVLEAFEGAGEHVARARSLVAAVDALEWLWADGRAVREPGAIVYNGSHYGSFAYAERRPDGVTVAALFNGRHPSVEPSAVIRQELAAALESVDDWP
ncbi:serine hydrolase domain-containing protein [Halopiger goleimassiliensis]|uniref:serine hydrolase domain-containing protein n=1 Tax=Halopiger goleimassiliensis TaxID=1293048 RepID=UPI000677A822|nr:serine hydrolase domain-containing protein [Halopiger goleimassiliensis]